MFTIQSDVPYPQKICLAGERQSKVTSGRKLNYKYGKPKRGEFVYPFKDMRVGDSVFFPDEPKGGRSNPAVAAKVYGAKYGKKFSARKMDGGVRIWRTE